MSQQTYSNDRPTFAELIAKAAGETAYKLPVEGRGTRRMECPQVHDALHALAAARLGPDDIGPDIAFDRCTGTSRHAQRILLQTGRAIEEAGRHSVDGLAAARRMAGCRAVLASLAYNAVARGLPVPPAPNERVRKDYETVILFAIAWLESQANEALTRAAGRWRRDAA